MFKSTLTLLVVLMYLANRGKRKNLSIIFTTHSMMLTASSASADRQPGVTTRYWDCCKASCGWSGKAPVSNPVRTCAKDGVTPVSINTQSGCNNGFAFMCNNQQPWSVSSTLSYGFAAASIQVRKINKKK